MHRITDGPLESCCAAAFGMVRGIGALRELETDFIPAHSPMDAYDVISRFMDNELYGFRLVLQFHVASFAYRIRWELQNQMTP